MLASCPSRHGASATTRSGRCWPRRSRSRWRILSSCTSRSTTACARSPRSRPDGPCPSSRLWSRAGNDKTAQFPAIVKALQRYALRRASPLLLDGEVVALDARGEPVGFQHLQGRIHRKQFGDADDAPSAFIAFDLLRDGPHDLRGLPLTARRAALERVFGDPGSPLLRLSPQVGQDGRDLYREAMARGWEGLIAKRASSRYFSGKRTTDWAKLKLQHAQEFVIGGWTEPRGARAHFGALLLGVYDDDGPLRLCRPRRHGVHRGRAGAADEGADAARRARRRRLTCRRR